MPARTCGGRNVSLRCQFLIDSLAPGKSRTGNHQLLPQIHSREEKKMLHQATSFVVSGKTRGMLASWELTVHASGFNPGSVTFVGDGAVEYGG
jgi:hypothetical protein